MQENLQNEQNKNTNEKQALKQFLLKKLGIFLAAVLLIGYVLVQFISSFGVSFDTNLAVADTIEHAVSGQAYVFRNEKPVIYEGGGIIRFVVESGSKVAEGGTIAEVYATREDLQAQQNYENIVARINSLETMIERASQQGASVETIDRNLRQLQTSMVAANMEQNGDLLTNYAAELLENLNRRQLTTGEVDGFSALLSSLNTERERLSANNSGPTHNITAESAGHFVRGGGALREDISRQEIIDANSHFVAALEKREQDENTIGRIISDFEWLIVVTVDRSEAFEFRRGRNIYTNFIADGIYGVPVHVENITSEGNVTFVVLSSIDIDENLATAQDGPIDLILRRYQGLRIETRAIRFDDEGYQGVFIDAGLFIRFRRIDVLYAGEGFVLVRRSNDSSGVQIFDNIIVRGNNLYDGRRIR